ncbi:MAG: FIVAR domain-containing protein, partial [Propionibacteriaceae bacterium]|nr:FIVAR domain-containing protein [Propionibacteriaceae bacterium]
APAEYTFAQSTTRLSGNNRESGNCANPKLRVSTPQDITAPNPGAYPVTFTMPNIGTMISSGGKIPHSHVFALGYDVAPVPPVTMSLTAETVPDQSTYVSTGTLPLATFAGDTPTTATINWGDATPVDKVNVTGSTIDGTHVYTIPGDYTAIVTATNGLRTAAVNVSIHVDETIFTPVVTATPSSVGWGDTVTVSGTGFASGATSPVDFGASTPNTTTYTADASGEFTAAFTVDYGIPSSTYPVSAIGSISNVMTSANVVVTAPDTTALQRLISEAQALDSEDFSVETWTPLAAELADAIATLADPQLTQAKVDAAVGQLQGALDDLVSIADLRDLLSTVYHTDTHTHALNPNDYTSSTWDDLVSAITRAEAELLKATHAAGGPTQADVDDAYAELSAAIAGLVLKGDPDALANLVAAAQAIAATGDYEPSQALDDWIATAQTAVANAADYSQRELDAIYLQLTDAMISLVPVAPTTTELRDLISSVGAALDPADYTAETAQAYTDALAAAQAVDADVRAGNIPSNDPAVSAALADLQDAIAQLVPAGYVPYTPPVVTKADLNTAVQAAVASPKDPAAYTPATYALYEAALADAQQVFNDPAATQAQVDAAYAALVQAITNLAPEEPVTQAVPPTTEYVPVPISTSLVKFAQKSVVLVKGKTFKVPVGIYYTSGATPSYRGWDVTWKSSNTKVATVREDGQITAKKAGTATITATAKKGTVTKTSVASIKVTVVKKKSAKKVSKITATVPKTMNVGQTVYLDAKYTSAKATQVKIKYSTKEFSIVGVDKAGRLTASKKGTDTLIIKAGKYTAKYKITVK